ncbi:glycoside hydrolase family 127 protein [Nesterenkonia suensis]
MTLHHTEQRPLKTTDGPQSSGAPTIGAAAPVVPAHGRRRGARTHEVRLDPRSFWGRRQEINARATLSHCVEWLERLGWLESFDRVARGEPTGDRPGWQFSDSEVYKLLEAVAWEQARTGDPQMEELHRGLVARIAPAQDDDGYLSTAFGHPGLPPRYSDLSMGHELYTMGHLLQAAVARARSLPPEEVEADRLVRVARAAAEHICAEFGPAGRPGICGHPEVEVALVELSRTLGESRYRDQARLFLDRRGHGSLPVPALLAADYFQDDVPLRRAQVLRGHAVRALYLTAGAVDLAMDTEDQPLLETLLRQWRRTVERRTYLTGGMGSRHQDEGFGEDFELPGDRAYCETCAGVASVMVSWRLYLATGEVEHLDLIERTLFNIIATSAAEDGRAFFYANPLQLRQEPDVQEAEGVHMRAEGGLRAPWFDVSCCPTNVARTLASLQHYVFSIDALEEPVPSRGPAASGAEGVPRVSVLQYMPGEIRAELPAGHLGLRVQGDYPHQGQVGLVITEVPEGPVRLRLRVPSWADGAALTVTSADGVLLSRRSVPPGWAEVGERLAPGDAVELDLGTALRLTWPDPRVDAVRGTVALERGPLVLCLESIDLPEGVALEDLRLDPDQPLVAHDDGARVRLQVVPGAAPRPGAPPFGPPPTAPESAPRTFTAPLVPYHRWAERGPSTMRVFLPLAGSSLTPVQH